MQGDPSTWSAIRLLETQEKNQRFRILSKKNDEG